MVTYSQLLILIACTAGLAVFVYLNWATYRRLHRDPGLLAPQPMTVVVQTVPQIENRSEGLSDEERERALFYMHQEQIRRLCDAKIEVVKSVVETQNRIALIEADVIRLQAEKELHLLASGAPDPVMIAHERPLQERPAASAEAPAGARVSEPAGSGTTGSSATAAEAAGETGTGAASHDVAGLEVVEAEVVDADSVPKSSPRAAGTPTAGDEGRGQDDSDDPDIRRIQQLREEQARLGAEAKVRLAEIDSQIRKLSGASPEAWAREQMVAIAGEIPLSEAGTRPYRPG